jgi:hypothetical protein
LNITSSCTLATSNTAWSNVNISATATITNNQLLTVLGTLSLTGASSTVTFAGTVGFNDSILSCTVSGVTLSLLAGATYNVYNSLTLHATLASPMAINSSDGTLTTALNYKGTAANQSVWFVNPTRVNSSGGNSIWSVGATIAGSTNWRLLVARGNSIN